MAKKKHYLNNKDLLSEIALSKINGKLTDKAVLMLILLAERIVGRMPYAENFLREEALSGAKLDFLLYWDRFNPEKSSNAFSYFSEILKNGSAKSFNRVYKYGKKFQGHLIRMEGNSKNHTDGGIYSI